MTDYNFPPSNTFTNTLSVGSARYDSLLRAEALELAAAMVETQAMRRARHGRFILSKEKRKHRGAAVAVAMAVSRDLRGAARLLRQNQATPHPPEVSE